MNIDDHLNHRARMLLFSTLELLRKEIRPKFQDWKDADDWLFSQLDFTKDELFQIYKGRDTMVHIGSAVEFPETKHKDSLITGIAPKASVPVSAPGKPVESFYYTFGTAKEFPYKKGWVEVRATDSKQADEFFRLRFPDRTEGILNCSFVYTQERFTKILDDVYKDNPDWSICHEVITLASLQEKGLIHAEDLQQSMDIPDELVVRLAHEAGYMEAKNEIGPSEWDELCSAIRDAISEYYKSPSETNPFQIETVAERILKERFPAEEKTAEIDQLPSPAEPQFSQNLHVRKVFALDDQDKCFIVQAPNGRFFNYYSEDALRHGYAAVGPFSNELHAESALRKHRPTAKQIGEGSDTFIMEKRNLHGYLSADQDLPKYPYDFGNGYKVQTFYSNLLPSGYAGDMIEDKEAAKAFYPGSTIVAGFHVVCTTPGQDMFPYGCRDLSTTLAGAIKDYEENILPHLPVVKVPLSSQIKSASERLTPSAEEGVTQERSGR